MSNLQRIEDGDLERVIGGDGYNAGDVANGVLGTGLALLGGAAAPAAVVAGGTAFAARQIGNLTTELGNLSNAQERSRQLDQQREAMIRRHPEYVTSGPQR